MIDATETVDAFERRMDAADARRDAQKERQLEQSSHLRHLRSSARVEALLDLVSGRLPDAGAAFIRCILAGAPFVHSDRERFAAEYASASESVTKQFATEAG